MVKLCLRDIGEFFVRVNRLSKVQDLKSQNKIEHNDTESYSKHSKGVAGKIVRKVETRVSETVPAPAEVPKETNTNMEGTEIDREAVKSRPIKINDLVRYKVDNEWITGTIMSRAGKATGKYQTWYNINEREQTLFRQIIGQLKCAVQGSRPDMAFDMIGMSTKLKQGMVGDLVRAIKKIYRLKDIRSYMTFPELDKMK